MLNDLLTNSFRKKTLRKRRAIIKEKGHEGLGIRDMLAFNDAMLIN